LRGFAFLVRVLRVEQQRRLMQPRRLARQAVLLVPAALVVGLLRNGDSGKPAYSTIFRNNSANVAEWRNWLDWLRNLRRRNHLRIFQCLVLSGMSQIIFSAKKHYLISHSV
jgi:hypothetical protein